MNPPVSLQEALQFHILWVFLAIALLIGALVLIIYAYKKYYVADDKKIIIKKPSKQSIPKIKEKYLNQINELEINLKNNTINNRQGYQKLSTIIRMFVYEMTGISVQNYTLEEIKVLRMPRLTKLVAEYYEPEFSSYDLGDALDSLSLTRKVVEAWQ